MRKWRGRAKRAAACSLASVIVPCGLIARYGPMSARSSGGASASGPCSAVLAAIAVTALLHQQKRSARLVLWAHERGAGDATQDAFSPPVARLKRELDDGHVAAEHGAERISQ